MRDFRVCENRSCGVDSVRVAVFIGETKTENPAQTAESVRVFVCACERENRQLSPTVYLGTHMHIEAWLERGGSEREKDIYLLFWVFRDIGEAFVFFLEKSLL